jgi:hypothetical protein
MHLADVERRLLVQCPLERADTVASVTATYRSGLVLTGPKPWTTIRHLHRIGYDGPILCDASRYAGRFRLHAGAGLRASWIAEQHDLGLVALTDSGYLTPGDWSGLHRLLDDAAALPPPLLVTLPLSPGWFAVRTWLDRLVTTLDEARLPVALVIGSDSFDTRYVTHGLVRLFSATAPIMVLRSGIGALGAICHGAHAGVLGVTSGLFVPALLGHHRPAVLTRIVDRTPDLARHWPCHCVECAGDPPTRLSPDGMYRHSLHAQLTLASQLLDADEPARAWREQCGQALAVHHEVAKVMPAWPIPGALRWWHELTPLPTPRQHDDRHAPRLGPRTR